MVKIGAAFAFHFEAPVPVGMRRKNFSVTHFMTALPVSDFARDVGIDYSRESVLSNTRAKSRPDDARDRAAPDDVREDRFSDFDKALRDQDTEEPARPRAERTQDRAPERVNERPKEVAGADAPRSEEPATPADSKSTPKPDAAKAKPVGEEPEPQTAAKPALILPEVVQVVSAAAPVVKSEALGESEAGAKAEGADAQAAADSATIPVAIAPSAAAQAGTQSLLAALAAGAPAPQQAQQHAAGPAEAGSAAPAPDPLAMLNGVQAGLKADAPAQGTAQTNGQAPAAQPSAVTPLNAAFEAAAATAPAPDAKLRQASDQNLKSADAPAQNAAATPAAAVQNAAQPAVALQNAVKAAAAQGSKDVKTADVQITDVKVSAPAQPSPFAAQLDAQSTQTTHASAAAPGQASPNATAIAHNVVRFFRETGSGNARFDIRLDPVELGRVDARVEINHDKTITLTLSAERPETLAELMRTARDLERQLTDSGVKLSEDGLKFRLNSDARGDAQQNMQNGGDGRRPARGAYGAGAESALQAEAAIPIRSWRASGVDVWA